MKIDVSIDANIAGIMESEILAGERAVTGGVRDVADWVKAGWRGQVTGSGLGQRLANTIRQNNYPLRGESLGAASLVYARPNRKKNSASAADVIDAFDRGVLITSREGFWLAIPLPAAGSVAGSGRRARMTPGLWEKRTGRRLKFVYRRGESSLLVDEGMAGPGSTIRSRMRRGDHVTSTIRGRKKPRPDPIPIFVLVPQARLKKRLDLGPITRAAESRLPAAILNRWK